MLRLNLSWFCPRPLLFILSLGSTEESLAPPYWHPLETLLRINEIPLSLVHTKRAQVPLPLPGSAAPNPRCRHRVPPAAPSLSREPPGRPLRQRRAALRRCGALRRRGAVALCGGVAAPR